MATVHGNLVYVRTDGFHETGSKRDKEPHSSASSVSVLFTLLSSAIMSTEAAEPGYIARLPSSGSGGPELPLVL
ncbi:hypothetical protein GBF38_004734 [Nibea albiflora]|uniref:Uncharacterized protein n=1 Tax=Nibea albiflora TaxID=240163 RepID=A0ACB7FD74_NIBAL|nr:hypothetical protein GBF38_004734 [Nibea albiflora]